MFFWRNAAQRISYLPILASVLVPVCNSGTTGLKGNTGEIPEQFPLL
jgi:hypothetical protein